MQSLRPWIGLFLFVPAVLCADDTVATAKAKLSPYVRHLARQVYFYHYGWRTPHYPNGAPAGTYDDTAAVPSTGNPQDFTGPTEPGGAQAEHYFRVKAGSYFGSKVREGEYGSGLYAANDPLDSLNYNGKPGLMLRVGVPAGTAYYDARKAKYVLLDLWAKQPLVLQQALRELGVEFVTGSYGEFQYPECKFSGLPRTADAIFLDPDFAPSLDLAILVPALEANASAEKRRIYGEVFTYFNAFDFSRLAGTRFGDESVSMRETVTREFWRYYEAWAPVLSGTSTSDWHAYQQAQSLPWQNPERRLRDLTQQLFGCSKEHPSELPANAE